MDLLYGYDKRHSYVEQPDMVDFLDPNDMFQAHMTGFPTPDDEGFENDWLNSFLDDPVLNDRMMTDAMQPPLIKSEHSYSINDNEPGSPLQLQGHEDMDSQLFSNNTALDLTMKPASSSPGECEITHTDGYLTVTTTAPMLSLTRQPTIIVTTSTPTAAESSSFYTSENITFPTIQIKHEPGDFLDQIHEQNVNLESIILPPTPPGSSGSDSEGSRSPQLSAPSSPMGQVSYRHSSSLSPVSDTTFTQPLFISPISQSGVLILSEEEKRTLISEGYPIPSKLPLTKQEEKNLKKIRRKIKNKISAQESRRKKKEYLEALEKRVEAYNHENSDLKKKLENLENNNRSLLGQLQKLQSLVSNIPKGASATQTSTALMVLVFCFAAFLGSMSPSNLNVGYYTKTTAPRFIHEEHRVLPLEVQAQPAIAHDNPYETPNLKSRVLMSIDQVDHCDDFRSVPWENAMLCPVSETSSNKNDKLPDPGVDLLGGANVLPGGKTTPDMLVVMVVSASFDNNSDTRGILADKYHHHSVMPDIRMVSKETLRNGMLQNMSVEKEMS